jgi:hypothetical protein
MIADSFIQLKAVQDSIRKSQLTSNSNIFQFWILFHDIKVQAGMQSSWMSLIYNFYLLENKQDWTWKRLILYICTLALGWFAELWNDLQVQSCTCFSK